MSQTQVVLATSVFKKGDKVRILRKAALGENGWRNAWVDKMDLAVGKTGAVVYHTPDLKDVTVQVPDAGVFGYPDFAVELIRDFKIGDIVTVTPELNPVWTGDGRIESIHPKSTFQSEWASLKMLSGKWVGISGGFPTDKLVLSTKTYPETPKVYIHYGFPIGSRVTVYGEPGIVVESSVPNDKYVRVNRNGYVGGWLPENVKLEPTPVVSASASESRPLKPRTGTAPAFTLDPLGLARKIAVELGQKNKTVDIDQVQTELAKQNVTSAMLGNRAGSVFTKNFRNTGETVKSTRKGNNRRPVVVWEYTGTQSTLIVPAQKFVVECQIGGNWERSQNYTIDGRPLNTFEFSSFEEADKEAKRQHQLAVYRAYRAVQLP
jgi:hypothetical protein